MRILHNYIRNELRCQSLLSVGSKVKDAAQTMVTERRAGLSPINIQFMFILKKI